MIERVAIGRAGAYDESMDSKPLNEGADRDERRPGLNRIDKWLTIVGAVFFGFVLVCLFVFFGFGVQGWGN